MMTNTGTKTETESQYATSKVSLVRRDNWAEMLTQFIHESRTEKVCLDWEYFNCISWACDAAEVMTGVDLYEEYRGESRSPASAFRMIKRHGFTSLVDIIESKLDEVSVVLAQRGDFVAVPMQGPWLSAVAEGSEQALQEIERSMPIAVGIADGPIYWVINEEGLASGPITDAVRAWRIGESC